MTILADWGLSIDIGSGNDRTTCTKGTALKSKK